MNKEFSKKDVAAQTGLTPRTVHYYTDIELVIPDIANPKGRGTTRRYSFENLVDFLLIKKLAGYGLSLKTIKNIMDKVREGPIRSWYSIPHEGEAYLILYDPAGDDIEVYLPVSPPREARRVFERRTKGYEEWKKSDLEFDFVPLQLDLENHTNAIVFNLTKLASELKSGS